MARIRQGRVVERKGRWYARIRWTDENGEEQDKWYPAANKSAATTLKDEKINELRTQGEEGLLNGDMAFTEFADDFEKTYLVPALIVNGIKISGRKSLVGVTAQLNALKAFFGKKKLNRIRYADVRAFRAERLATPVIKVEVNKEGKKVRVERQRKLASVNRELQLLRRMLNVALREGLITKNPFNCGDPLISAAAEDCRDRTLSYDEETRMLIACEAEDRQTRQRWLHLRPIIIAALETAMRRGEIFSLERRDIDLENNMMTVRAENAKTMKPRTVPITPRLRAELEQVLAKLPDEPEQRVFPFDSVKKSFAGVCAKAKVYGLRFHDLRHSSITRMIAAGIPAPEVMKISGHSQQQTFLRYLNPTGEAMKRASDLLTAFNEQQGALVATSEMVN
jgi:integrase